MRHHSFALLFALLIVAAIPAFAQNDLYDNGPIDGEDYAWAINFGFQVSDTFTLNCGPTNPCSVNGLVFEIWLFPGDTFQSSEVSITSSEFGGTTYFDQTVAFTESACFLNNSQYGVYNVCTATGSFPTVSLSSGNYWLTLLNGQVDDGDPVFWDQNYGPSEASQSSLGTVPSESFTILGTTTTVCYYCGTVPEPTGLGWLAGGLLGLLLTGSRRYL